MTIVMIGSQAIATGVDDVQTVCHTMIINLLPMTNAEYRQLRGRLLRIGQKAQQVRIVILITEWHRHGADAATTAAVDGVSNEDRFSEDYLD